MLEREKQMVTEARDALLIEAGRGVNAMSRMTQRVEEVMTRMKFSYCTGCQGGGDREQFEPRTLRAHSAGSNGGYPAYQVSPAVGEKGEACGDWEQRWEQSPGA